MEKGIDFVTRTGSSGQLCMSSGIVVSCHSRDAGIWGNDVIVRTETRASHKIAMK